MPSIGLVDAAPAWAWPDAVVALVLAVSLCVLLVRGASWVRRQDASPGTVTGRVPVGIGLVLALMITLLVRGHPDQQALVGLAATALAALSAFRSRPRADACRTR